MGIHYLILYIFTILISYGIDVACAMKIIKDIANSGYKINRDTISNLSKQLGLNNYHKYYKLLPLYNIFRSLYSLLQYNNNRDSVLTALDVAGALEEMTESEKEQYLKKPTTLNYLLVITKSEVELNESISITYRGDFGLTNKYFLTIGNDFFKTDNLLDDFSIIKVEGPDSRLSIYEQKEKCTKLFCLYMLVGLDKYGNTSELIQQFKRVIDTKGNIDLNELLGNKEIYDIGEVARELIAKKSTRSVSENQQQHNIHIQEVAIDAVKDSNEVLGNNVPTRKKGR